MTLIEHLKFRLELRTQDFKAIEHSISDMFDSGKRAALRSEIAWLERLIIDLGSGRYG